MDNEEYTERRREDELWVHKVGDIFELMVKHNIESYKDQQMEISRESLKIIQEKNADLHRTKQAVRK